MSQKSVTVFMVLTLCLLISIRSENWQGTGEFSSQMLSNIWTTIQDNIQNYIPISGSTDLPGFATFLSDTYNRLHATAWNVFVIELMDPTLDAIVVGYAFRKHWLWFNNFQHNGRHFSFVIWKDYNCGEWVTLDNSMMNNSPGPAAPYYNFHMTITGAKGVTLSSYPTYAYDDIWATQNLLIRYLESTAPSTVAYSLLAVQSGFSASSDLTSVNGRFCAITGTSTYTFFSEERLNSIQNLNNNGIHKIIAFQTRNT